MWGTPTLWARARLPHHRGLVTESKSGDRLVSFGFKNVSEAFKARLGRGVVGGPRFVPNVRGCCQVGRVFERVADRYDLMNDLMTAGIHRRWKDQLVAYADLRGRTRVLDVAGGTGDIAFRLLASARRQPRGTEGEVSVTLVDINEKMIQVGRERAQALAYHGSQHLNWMVGDAEALQLEDAAFDLYTIAFGIRNCTHIERVLSEAHRVLRPGGRFLCLELSPDAFAQWPNLRRLYDRYSFDVIPVLGQLVAADKASYQYLVESIRRFPGAAAFSTMIQAAGFTAVAREALLGGVAYIHSATKQ